MKAFHTIAAGSSWVGWVPTAAPAAGALYEMTVWASSGDGAIVVTAGGYNITLGVTVEPRNCSTSGYVGCFTEGRHLVVPW